MENLTRYYSYSCLYQSLIRVLRRLVFNFLSLNSDLEVDGKDLTSIMEEKNYTLEEYTHNVVIPQGNDAEHVIFLVTPLVLRIRITFVMLSNNPGETDNPVTKYEAKAKKLDYFMDDGLDLHEESLSILVTPAHFDVLYSKDFIKKYPEIINDANIGQEPAVCTCKTTSSWLEQCKKSRIDRESALERIERETNGKFLLTGIEKQKEGVTCEECKGKISNKQIMELIDNEEKKQRLIKEKDERKKEQHKELLKNAIKDGSNLELECSKWFL
eukprot:TRINITY_DN1587_c0_g1_i2.p2 TRINITY_DN1587_c0_g1~~TRINITY_DN1587_c0_g1_i2.p2  ORF type:complete len:271 (+),score=52.13 TRINITY_DN1587_c0_g1_i2:2824-3636(+)